MTTHRRTAIIGGGMVGRIHRQALSSINIPLHSVLGSTPSKSEALAQEWGAEHAFDTVDELADSNVDAVHICSPTGTHAHYARVLLKAGKHVICEKPLATSAADAAELATLAENAGVIAAVPFVYRYYSAVREIRTRVHAGELGALSLLHGSYLQDWLLDPLTSNWRVVAASGGRSRAFADIGSHWCDLIEWITGERFVALVAQLSIAIPERPAPLGPSFSATIDRDAKSVEVDTEDTATVLLRTDQGTPASLTVSQVAAGRKNRLQFDIDGASGSAAFDHEKPEQAWFADSYGDVSLFARGAGTWHRTDHLPSGHPQGWDSAFSSFVEDFYAAVSGDNPDGLPIFADGVRATHITEAVLTSAAQQSWVEIPQ